MNNSMLIWDQPFNTFSQQVYIAFDTDSTKEFAGFKRMVPTKNYETLKFFVLNHQYN